MIMASRRYKVKKGAQIAETEEVKDFIEKPEVLVEQLSKTEAFFQKHKTLALGVMGAVIVVIGGFLGYQYYLTSQNDIAQREMFQAVFTSNRTALPKH